MNAVTEKACMGENARYEAAVRGFYARNVLVMGLAKTGAAAAAFLAKCGASVSASDEKDGSLIPGAQLLEAEGVVLETGGHTKWFFDRASMIVVSPGVPFRHPLLEAARLRGAEVISEVELAYRFMDCPVAAVAGTNGKSTTTELLGRLIGDAGKRPFVGGNIGTPAIEYAEAISEGGERPDVAVLEVSSFQLETTGTFNPNVGVLLNVTEDHLDRYNDFNEYAETKFRLFMNQTPSDHAVVNADDPVIAARLGGAPFTRGRVLRFSVSAPVECGAFLDKGRVVLRGVAGEGEESYPVSSFSLKGLHNVENVMAALIAARLLGVPADSAARTLASFKGLPHRMELVRTLDGVEYVDDSKGTNVGSLLMALKGADRPVVLIAGGRDKGGDYGVLAEEVKGKVKLLILLGEARHKMRDALGAFAETVLVESMEDAVRLARARSAPVDMVLLCPACSSFDMFRDYKERGDRFKALVAAL